MGNAFRLLGVHGDNLPTKETLGVLAANFNIAGLICEAERKYDKAIVTNNFNEWIEWFGDNYSSSKYGYDCAQGFFQNTSGVSSKLYTYSRPGATDVDTIDAVVASAAIDDQQGVAEDVLTIQAANQEELEYGISGNRTGYQIENGTRSTAEILTAGTKDDTWIYADATSDIKVGDIIKVVATGGGGATVYKKVTAVEESNGKVSFTGAFHAAANTEVGDDISVLGFQIRTYRKDINGLVAEVDTALGDKWLSTESNNTEYYVENVINPVSKWIKVTRNSTTPTDIEDTFPANVTTTTYLTSGADGTAGTTAATWARTLTAFDNLPVRMLTNCETTTEAIHVAGEAYCKSRIDDEPKWHTVTTKDMTKAQGQALGKRYQRSDEVLNYVNMTWYQISDPFNTSENAPPRDVPNVGHNMGCWIRTIAQYGVHYSPATGDTPILGIIGIVDDNLGDDFSDQDRTDLLNDGTNVTLFIDGTGYRLGNHVTPSTSVAYRFANAGLQKSFYKVSIIGSLKVEENRPNSFDRIREGRDAIYNFMFNQYLHGSTGNVREGETFGAQEGQVFDDLVEIQGDAVNNSQSSINAGNRNYDIWFNAPSPTVSIKVGLGRLVL